MKNIVIVFIVFICTHVSFAEFGADQGTNFYPYWAYTTLEEDIGQSNICVAQNGSRTEIIFGGALSYVHPYANDTFWQVLVYDNGSYLPIHFSTVRKKYPIYDECYTIRGIRVGDCLGDSELEIVVLWEDCTIEFYRLSNKSKIKSFTKTGTSTPYGLELADLNGDNKSEILFVIPTTGYERLYVLNSNGSTLWSPSIVQSFQITVGQMDSDPSMEIAVGGGQVFDYDSRSLQWNYGLNNYYADLRAVDVDNDGMDELITLRRGYDVDTKSQKWDLGTLIMDTSVFEVLDIDNDSHYEEVVVSDNGHSIQSIDLTTLTVDWSSSKSDSDATDVAVADVDQDGTLEILFGDGDDSSGEDHLRIINAATRVEEWTNIHYCNPFQGPEIGDVDGDGVNEIVIGSFECDAGYDSGRLLVFNGNTLALRGVSDPIVGNLSWEGLNEIDLEDVDGDGNEEIFVATEKLYDGVFEVYDFSTSNIFSLKKQVIYSSLEKFRGIKVEDVDNDSDLEVMVIDRLNLICINYNSGAIEWSRPYSSYVTGLDLGNTDNDSNLEAIIFRNADDAYVIDCVTHAQEALIDGTFTALDVIDGAIILGNSTGYVSVYEHNGSSYSRTFNQQLGVSEIDGLTVDSVNPLKCWISCEGNLCYFNGSTKTIQTASYGAIFGKHVRQNNQTDAFFTVGDYCIVGFNTDEYIPFVSSITRADANPTNSTAVDFTVTFDESVTGVDTTDFLLTTSGVSGTTITAVVGSGDTYTVTVDTGSGDGTIRLDVYDDDTIINNSSHPLGGPGTGNANYTSGETYIIEKTPPTVTSINRTDANPTNASTVHFTVTFSKTVNGVDTGDFALTTTGVSGASVTNVSGSGNTYSVTLDTGSGDGTIRLDVIDNDTIVDVATNPLGGSGTGNGDYTSGEIYTIDKTPPVVDSILCADTNPTTSTIVHFTVTFSESVSNVDTNDFSLTVSSCIFNSEITDVSGSGDTYTVTVNTGTGDGTIRLDVMDDDTIIDVATNPLAGSGSGNGNYTSGESYIIDRVSPSVIASNRLDSNPTNASQVQFAVEFNETVTGVDTSDLTLTTSGVSGPMISNLSGSGNIYTVTVTTGSGDGTIRLDILDDDTIIDVLSKSLGGSGTGNGDYTSGEVYTIDRTSPVVDSIVCADANPTSSTIVHFTVTFSESVSNVDTNDFSLTVSSSILDTLITNVSGSGDTYTISVNTGTGEGTIRLDVIDNDSIIDMATNPLAGSGSDNGNYTSGEVYIVDKVSPSVIASNRLDTNPTNASQVQFAVEFNETVTGVDTSDFTLTTSGVSGAAVSTMSGSGNIYFVTVTSGDGDGAIRLDITDNDTIIDTVSKPLGGPGSGNGDYTSGESYLIDKTPPSSSATGPSGTLSQTDPIILISYTAHDETTSVYTTYLYYRKDGQGGFQEYGSGFTSSPISFNTTPAGGNGIYELYTCGVDTVGNIEPAPSTADITIDFTLILAGMPDWLVF